MIFKNNAALSKIRLAAWTCHHADEEMRFQASCEGGREHCRQTQFSWYPVPSLRTGNSKVPATNGCGCPLHVEFVGGSRPHVDVL